MPTKPKTAEAVEESKDKPMPQLSDLFRKALLATIGAAAIAQEEVEALINRLVERGELAEQEGKKLAQEMMEKRKTKTVKVEAEISKNLEGVLERMNIPTKADVDALSQKISGLSKKIDELKKTE
jgi:poly(hydroxyalkanoate) granule-associated protein